MTDLTAQVRADLRAAAELRRDALQAVGFPTSALWLSLQAPGCDEGYDERDGSAGEMYAAMVRGGL